MISLSLRNVGTVYDELDNDIGKFLVSMCQFYAGKMPKFMYVTGNTPKEPLWQSADEFDECKPVLQYAPYGANNIRIVMDIIDSTKSDMFDGFGWDDDPKVVGHIEYYYEFYRDGIYRLKCKE